MKKFTPFYLFCVLLLAVQCGTLPGGGIYRPGNTGSGTSVNESGEFAELIAKDQINKTQETADVLNYLLNDDDPADPYTAIVLENTSSCDIIVRVVQVSGGRIYNFPVPRNAKNHFKIAKGNYTLKSNICEAKYYSQKNISEALIITLSR